MDRDAMKISLALMGFKDSSTLVQKNSWIMRRDTEAAVLYVDAIRYCYVHNKWNNKWEYFYNNEDFLERLGELND